MKRTILCLTAEEFGRTRIDLGRVGEDGAVRIMIDLSSLLAQDPKAIGAMTVEGPKGNSYPAVTNQEGTCLVWDVPEADVAEEGADKIQLTVLGSKGEILKSVVAATKIGHSIRGEGTAPDPVQNWVDDATSKLGNVVSSGENAKEAAEKAEEAAKRANDAAEKAENGVVQSDYAQNNATQPDYIKNRPGGYYQTVPGVDIIWDGVIGDRPKAQMEEVVYLVKVGDEVLAAEQLVGATVTMVNGLDNTSRVLLEDNVMSGDGFVMNTRREIISCSKTTFEINGLPLTFPETGTYFISVEEDGYKMYVSSLTKPEKQELVPIPGELMVLRSSTAGSTKKFKITVDDAGTLSATEVTS